MESNVRKDPEGQLSAVADLAESILVAGAKPRNSSVGIVAREQPMPINSRGVTEGQCRQHDGSRDDQDEERRHG